MHELVVLPLILHDASSTPAMCDDVTSCKKLRVIESIGCIWLLRPRMSQLRLPIDRLQASEDHGAWNDNPINVGVVTPHSLVVEVLYPFQLNDVAD